MFHERFVPRKSKYECTDKNGKYENENFRQGFVHFFSVSKISEHFIYYQYFFFFDISNEENTPSPEWV